MQIQVPNRTAPEGRWRRARQHENRSDRRRATHRRARNASVAVPGGAKTNRRFIKYVTTVCPDQSRVCNALSGSSESSQRTAIPSISRPFEVILRRNTRPPLDQASLLHRGSDQVVRCGSGK